MFEIKNAKFGQRVLVLITLALTASIGISAAQAAPIIVSKPQIEIDSCSEERCSLVKELEYSPDGKSAFGVLSTNGYKGEKYFENYSLFKHDFASKRTTVLVSLPAGYDGAYTAGQTVSTYSIDNVRPSNDRKSLFYIERKDSQTVESLDADGNPKFKNYVKTASLKLRNLATGKTEILNTKFGLKQSQVFHVSWSSNSKSLNLLHQTNSGLQWANLTLSSKKLTKGSSDSAPVFLSRNGKYASTGIWWLGEQKYQVVATRKTTKIDGSIYGPIVLFNDGIHMIANFQGSGLTIFTTSGKKKVLVPEIKFGKRIRWYSLSPDEKSLIFVYDVFTYDEGNGEEWASGYNLLKVELPE